MMMFPSLVSIVIRLLSFWGFVGRSFCHRGHPFSVRESLHPLSQGGATRASTTVDSNLAFITAEFGNSENFSFALRGIHLASRPTLWSRRERSGPFSPSNLDHALKLPFRLIPGQIFVFGRQSSSLVKHSSKEVAVHETFSLFFRLYRRRRR